MQLLLKVVKGIVSEKESKDDMNSSDSVKIEQTMIFVNTANDAALLAKLLRNAGLNNAEYHKCVIEPVRQESLRLFRAAEVSVLVCTDHAARGLDLPNVRHVIQAEFATNVVQYLHRIGRASRAGVLGKATNIYDDRSVLLVRSILSENENEKSVDQSFSRRRGFSKKIKKNIRFLNDSMRNEAEVGNDLGNEVEIEVEVIDSSNVGSTPVLNI